MSKMIQELVVADGEEFNIIVSGENRSAADPAGLIGGIVNECLASLDYGIDIRQKYTCHFDSATNRIMRTPR